MGGFDRSRYQTRRRVVVAVCPLIALIDEHARLDQAVRDELADIAKSHDSLTAPPEPPSADALAEVEARLESERDYFVIEKVGYSAWLALQLDHPPENFSQQRSFGFNPATFYPAALVASCTCVTSDPDEAEAFCTPEGEDPVPVLDIDGAAWLFSELDQAQWNKLQAAIEDVNMGAASAPKSTALALLGLTSKPTSSGTASTTESRSTGSSVPPSTGGPTTT